MLKAIILAAGKGTRMNSDIPKVLNEINEKTLIQYVIDNCEKCRMDNIYVIVGYKAEDVKKAISNDVVFVEQKELLGTGHAVLQAKNYINDEDCVIVLNGDHPLFKGDTIKEAINVHKENKNVATILTTKPDDAASYGRIIRDEEGNIKGIVEKKDASEEQIKIKEVNTGHYCFNGKYLKEALLMIENHNAQKEYYLTDTIKILVDAGHKIGGYIVEDYTEALGINTVEELKNAEEIMKLRMEN